MKKILLLVSMLVMVCSASFAFDAGSILSGTPDTALFIQIDPNGVGKPQETEEMIAEAVEPKLKSLQHPIVDTKKAQKDLRIYLRENADTVTQRGQDKGVVLKSKDFKALAEMEKVRYVVLISSRITSAEVKEGFFHGDRKNLTVLTDVVVYDAQAEDYLMDQEFSDTGKTSGSYDRAYNRAIKKMLEEVRIEY